MPCCLRGEGQDMRASVGTNNMTDWCTRVKLHCLSKSLKSVMWRDYFTFAHVLYIVWYFSYIHPPTILVSIIIINGFILWVRQHDPDLMTKTKFKRSETLWNKTPQHVYLNGIRKRNIQNTAPGQDGILYRILRHLCPHLTLILIYIVNRLWIRV